MCFLIDASTSMGDSLYDVIEGFNNFLGEQASLGTKVEALLTVATFRTGGGEGNYIRTLQRNVPLSLAQPLSHYTYVTGGLTPLYEGIATTLQKLREDTSHNDKVVMFIVCDGDDNRSRIKGSKTRALMEEANKRGWEFVFVGVATGSRAQTELGVTNTAAVTRDALREQFKTLSSIIAKMRTHRAHASDFNWSTGAPEVTDNTTDANTVTPDSANTSN